MGCCSEYKYDSYQTGVPLLGGTTNDAREMKELLLRHQAVRRNNIDYLVDQDATRQNIINHLKKMENSDLKRGDTLYLYYSGHGTSLEDRKTFSNQAKNNRELQKYLEESTGFIPYDFDKKDIVKSLLITKRDFKPTFKKLDKRGVNIVWMVDACFAGNAYRSANNSKGKVLKLTPEQQAIAMGTVDSYREDKKTMYNHLLFYSASISTLSANEISDSSNQKRGAFSIELERCLDKPSNKGEITHQELSKCITSNHTNNALQPSFYPNLDTEKKQQNQVVMKTLPKKPNTRVSKSYKTLLFELDSTQKPLEIGLKSIQSPNAFTKTFCNREVLSVVLNNADKFVIALSMDVNGMVIMIRPSKNNPQWGNSILKTRVQPPFGKDKLKVFTTNNRELFNRIKKYSDRSSGILSGNDIEQVYKILAQDRDFRSVKVEIETIERDVNICREGD